MSNKVTPTECCGTHSNDTSGLVLTTRQGYRLRVSDQEHQMKKLYGKSITTAFYPSSFLITHPALCIYVPLIPKSIESRRCITHHSWQMVASQSRGMISATASGAIIIIDKDTKLLSRKISLHTPPTHLDQNLPANHNLNSGMTDPMDTTNITSHTDHKCAAFTQYLLLFPPR
jgi:hypothetical protein